MADVVVFLSDGIEIKQLIGCGRKSSVFAGKVKRTGEDVAVKKLIHKTSELDILKRLRHENIIQLIGTIERESAMGVELVLEYAPDGNLYDILKSAGRSIPEYEWCKQTAIAVEYIHENNISHRQINSRKYLVFGNVLKLSDFSWSNRTIDIGTMTIQNLNDTVNWMSPEILEGKDHIDHPIDHFKSDIYSLSVVLWELLHKKKPYDGWTMNDIMHHVVTNRNHLQIDYQRDRNSLCSEILLRCWEYEPSKRPTADETVSSFYEVFQCDTGGTLRGKYNHDGKKETDFRDFLIRFSSHYQGEERYRQLRFLLYDTVSVSVLTGSNTVMNLFNDLTKTGRIGPPTNVDILLDIAKVTHFEAAKFCIHEYTVNKCSTGKSNTRLTEYRKGFFRALIEVTASELQYVVACYGLEHQGFADFWDLTFHLENQMCLNSNEQRKWFANLLNARAKKILLDSLPEEPAKKDRRYELRETGEKRS